MGHAELYMAGSGTASDPYQVTNCSDLSDIGNDTANLNDYYILTQSFSCSDTINWNGGEGFDPIGSLVSQGFTGNFYGAGYSVSDLFINRLANNTMIGLFCNISDGNVSNLNLVNIAVNGSDYVGSLAGYVNNSVIDNVYVDGNVTGESRSSTGVGGLIGKSSNSTISFSNTSVVVSSIGNHVGGLVGHNFAYSNSNATINSCNTTGNVSGTGNNVGGLVGYNYAKYGNVYIDNSYATGNVSGTGNNVGGLVGDNKGNRGDANISDSYATGNVTGNAQVGGLVGHNFGTNNGGDTNINNSYATGNVSGIQDVGGLVGYNRGGDYGNAYVDNSYATGSVTGIGNSVGGLVGWNYASANGNVYIDNSYANGSVTSTGGNVGGLVGYIYANGAVNIDNCYATGSVTEGGGSAGGLVGSTKAKVGLVINNSYATGSVTGTGNVGGLVGRNNGYNNGYANIDNCYAIGNVTGTGTNVGGLVGKNYVSYDGYANIDNSYATGNVTGNAQVGGLVGYNYGGSHASIDNSYWYNDSEDGLICVGRDDGDGSTTCTDILNISWFYDFNNVPTSGWSFPPWDNFCNNQGYPSLSWQNIVSYLLCGGDDLTAPNITLDGPEDFFNESVSGWIVFNYTASDVRSDLDTCELWGNWSGGWHLNESITSPPEDATNGSSNVSLMDGLYVWSVYCNDSLGNYNNTVANYTLTVDTTATVVTLDAPSDNSYDTDGDVNFSFTAVEPNPDRCTLWFRSNETNWAQNDSTTYSNNVQTNIFVNLTDAVYVWNVECNDTVNKPAFASANRTLTVDTVVPPTPTLTAPTDTSINPRDSISYTCESIDATAGISKWTWTLTKPPDGGTVTKTGGEVTSNTQTFSGDDTNLAGSYTAKCEAEDKAGHKSSSSSTFSVYYSHVTEGAGVGPSAAADIDLSTAEETTITEKQGVISTFTLDGTTVHTITIKTVDEVAGTVTIIIESDPIEITLKIGETEEVDIDGDGTNDLSVTLNKIVNGAADITTKRLAPLPKEEVPTEEVPPTEKPAEEIPTAPEVPSKTWLWILIIVIIVVIGVGYWFMKKKYPSTFY